MTAPGHLTHRGSEGYWFTTRKDRIAGYTPANPAPFAFEREQSVTVIRPGEHYGKVGTVSSRWHGSPHRYTVDLGTPGVLTPIYPFLETELKATDVRPMVIAQLPAKASKARKSVAPDPNKDDCVMVFGRMFVEWQTTARRLLIRERAFAARQRAKNLVTDNVIYLPAQNDKKRATSPETIVLPVGRPKTPEIASNAPVCAFLEAAMKYRRVQLAKVAGL